jgi:hypothetical protein
VVNERGIAFYDVSALPMEATGKKRCADKLGCHGCEMATNARHADIAGVSRKDCLHHISFKSGYISASLWLSTRMEAIPLVMSATQFLCAKNCPGTAACFFL